jgi:hypothetical protein
MTYPFQNPDLPLDERVRDLISRLTIDEKAGFIPTKNHAVERLGIPAWSIGAEGCASRSLFYTCHNDFLVYTSYSTTR